MIHVALKEGREETGLKKLELLSESILAIDILPVPPHVKRGAFVSSHVHLNVTYLCQADERDTLCSKPDENSGVRWIAVEEINHYVTEEDMKPVYRKLVEKSRSLLLAG
ncbi:NUDIX domain-containing protein [[Clostridium] innocuum]|nr:NUDIX domain-containing protein [[Clostridium] innocuum]